MLKNFFSFRRKVKFSANPDADQLSKLILLPNIARKVIEAFLLFKFPSIARNNNINLFNQLKPLGVDIETEKLSVIDRLLNRGSHGDETSVSTIKMPDLSETPKVIDYVLEFIEKADKHHFDGLKAVIGCPNFRREMIPPKIKNSSHLSIKRDDHKGSLSRELRPNRAIFSDINQ